MIDRKAYMKQWSLDNKEYRKEYKKGYGKKYRENNSEKIKERMKKWYIKNKDKLNEQARQWKENHPKYIREYRLTQKQQGYIQQYYADNSEKMREKSKQWRKNNPEYRKQWYLDHPEYDKRRRLSPEGKMSKRKCYNKRRGLDFIPLNKPFVNCEAHHISQSLVIYIPKKFHRNIRHNIWTWKNMDIINKVAIEYL